MKPTKKKIVVKAWYAKTKWVRHRAAFFDKRRAKNRVAELGGKVIPCTITYEP